jgi:polar amino acid transport system substrate-binding protein
MILLSSILAACGSQQPANHLQAIRQSGVIKVGTSADYPPFEYIDNDGKKVGFDIALMEEIARRLEVELEWADIPFDNLIAAVEAGKIDLAISAFNYSPEGALEIDFSDAYYLSEDALMVTDQFTGTIATPLDVASYQVGVQTGSTQEYWLVENLITTGKLPEANLFRYERTDQAAKDLKNGRIEVWMGDYVPGQALVLQLGGLKIVYKGVLSSGPMYIVCHKDDTALLSKINKTIKSLENEGFIQQLALEYIGGIK